MARLVFGGLVCVVIGVFALGSFATTSDIVSDEEAANIVGGECVWAGMKSCTGTGTNCTGTCIGAVTEATSAKADYFTNSTACFAYAGCSGQYHANSTGCGSS